MDSPASRRDFLQQAAAAAGAAATLGLNAVPVQAQAPPPDGASKFARLRALLRAPGLLTAPEAYTVIAGKLAEARGFDAVYIGGNMMSMTYLGAPDWGIITTTDMVEIAGRIAREVRIPAIVDADQAGETSLNVYRTVQLYERAGIAALHIEDSVNPKKMETWAGPGGPTTSALQTVERMRERLEAAVDGRTNRDFVIIGRTVAEDLDTVIRRGQAFARAGADVVMNSLTGFSAEQINRIAGELPVPLLGIGVAKPLLTNTRMKVNIHPNMVSQPAMALCDAMLQELRTNGEVTPRPTLSADILSRVSNSTTYAELARRWLSVP
ncbi:MAG: isocitrate lyase/PEP mutase family protein [Acidimicrobiia bacterium]|nr:isocitrate lyase/PEP mutase family protein [Acidimicrobiia bacterium]